MSTSKNNNYLKFPHKASTDGPVSKALKFLLTDRGRRIIHYAAGAATLGVTIGILSKETYFLENILNRYQVYRCVKVWFRIRSALIFKFCHQSDGFPMEVPDNLEERIDACMDKGKLSGSESAHVKSLMINGFDIRSFGRRQAMHTNEFI